MLFAIMIIAIAMPFAYRQINDTARRLTYLNVAREFIASSDYIKGYMRLYDDSFPLGELIQVESDDKDRIIFIDKSDYATTAFIVFSNHGLDMLAANQVRALIGNDAAVVEEDGAAYSFGGNWSIKIDNAQVGDIILRISNMRRDNNAEKYLHKTTLTDGELSTMRRDLFMGNNAIHDIGDINARLITTSDLDINLLRVPIISAASLFFVMGANLNPDKSSFKAMRITGGIIGFRGITGAIFENKRFGITAERTNITKSLIVTGRFEVRSPTQRSISGFAGVSAATARIPYLDTQLLEFLPDFGLVVSGENLYSTTPPIRIGGWSFPNSGNTGPRFNKLILGRHSVILPVSDFSEILKEGWK